MRKERSQAMKGALREYDLRRGSVRLGYVLMMVVLAVAVFVALMPILWVLLSGFKDIKELTRGIKNPETKRYVQHLLPASFSLEGYQYTWNQMRYLGDYFNSLLVVAGSVVCALLFNGLLAYGLSRLKPRGWKLIMALIMGTMMVPATTSVAPLFANLVKLGFAGSFVPLWLSAGASAFYVILFKNFYDDIPDSLLEAARLDGCNNWQMFFRIVLPLSKPISMVILIYAVNAAWSDFLLPYLLLNGVRSKWTVMVHLFTYQSAIKVTDTDVIRAIVFAIVPPIVLYILFQRQITANVMSSGIKG